LFSVSFAYGQCSPDVTPPTINCPGNISAACPHSPSLDALAPTTSDNCGPIVLQTYTLSGATTGSSAPSGINDVNSVIFLAGTTTVNYYIEDASGNSATCSFNVTVNDFTSPIVVCQGDIVTINDPGLCTAYVDMFDFNVFPTAFDSCSGLSTVPTGVPSGSMFPVGTTTVIWVVSDAAGNFSTCPQNITVTDEENPTILCPSNISVTTDPGQCNAFVNVPLAFASDNCTVSSVSNSYNGGGANASGTYPIGTTTVTFTVTDATNKTDTCSMDITVVNSQSPTITLLGANPLTLEACSTYNELGATASDPCFGNVSGSIVIDTSALNTNSVGSYAITYTVTNGNGNSTQVIRTVNIVDTTVPTLSLTGPNPLTISDCSTYTELGALALDPCIGDISSNVVVDNSAVNTNVLGSYTVTYNVTDNSGNVAIAITRTVNVVDSTPPDIFLIGDNPQIIEACDAYNELGATAIDPCFGTDFTSSIAIDASMVNTSIPGIYSVTYNVVDSFGNIAIEVIRDIEVINTITPTISCPGDIIADNDVDDCFALINFTTPVGTANCPLTLVQTAGLPSGSNFPIGTTTNTFEVTDPFGQTAICSFDVIINDVQNPTTICNNISIQLDPITGLASITPSDIDNGSTDNCNFTLTLSQTDFDCSNIGDNLVTLTSTDDSGNLSTCVATVTVTDLAQNASVSISESENPICQNTSVTFTATPVDAGTNPLYQWQINGLDVSGETASTFTTTNLNDADIVTVLMTSNASICASAVVSNSITMQITDYNPPADAGPDITNTICTNTTLNLAGSAIIGSGTIGLWTVTSGQTSGFSFSDDTSPTSTFTGDIGETYILTWSIDNPDPCPDSSDSMEVTFINCSALDFDGVDDNITFRNNYNLNGDFTIEVWVKSEVLNSDIQTIFSKREANNQIDGYDLRLVDNYVSFNWNNGLSLTSPFQTITNQWHHIAVTFESGTYILYIDGIEMNSAPGSAPISNTVDCILGAMDQTVSAPFKPLNYFNGGMDELRIWDVALSSVQIRKMMNQEIEDNVGNVKGVSVPLDIAGLSWTDLSGYYQMNQSNDILGGNLISSNGNSIDGLLRYMTTLQPESAPIPYRSIANGLWTNPNTWLNGTVQAIPNSMGVDGTTQVDWNIVRTSHNISSNNNNIILLGLEVDTNTLSIENTNPLDGQSLRITDYLIINGTLDLVGESQLLQDSNSIVDYTGTGNLQRDQQGTSNLFNYNYWGSPVSINGLNFNVGSILFDGSTANPQAINWTTNHNATGSVNPITLSSRWIYTYEDTPGADYFDWVYKGQNNPIDIGLGFTMKGSGVGDPVTDNQNYVFIGQPNNSDITIPISAPYQALIGNPYPSAIDANQFIIDNGPSGTNAIEGSLYFWEHSTTNNSHVLSEYEGGYATYNLSGGVAAIIAPSEIGGLGTVNKIPEQYIPIAQGFYVTSSAAGGIIQFNNDQRIFIKESSGNSIFLRENQTNSMTSSNDIKRLRLNVTTTDGSIRPLLLAFTPNGEATEGVDFGYDAENTETFPNDACFMIENRMFIIQGVGSFNATNQYPIGLFLSDSGNVEIALTSLENFDTEVDVYVYDALLQTSTRINNSNFMIYLGANEYLNRFFITFQPSEALSNLDTNPEDLATVSYLNDTDEIYINIPNALQLKQVHLYNIIGQKVKTWNVTNLPVLSNELHIPVRNISEGAYIVKVETNSGTLNKKVIIKY
jgi:hypothetical protein